MNSNNNHIIFNNRDNNRAGDMSPDLRNAESPVSRVPPRMLSNALAGGPGRACGRPTEIDARRELSELSCQCVPHN